MMPRLSLLLCTLLLSSITYAQSPVGTWVTIDDEDGEPASHVEIYQKEGALHGKIVELIDPESTICTRCEGDKKDQPIMGMEIMWGLTHDDDEWNGGKIMDPKNGKTYKCLIKLEDEDTLKVRGYIGFSLLGRTQEWRRLK